MYVRGSPQGTYSFARLFGDGRSGDPNLAAGGPTKRKERQGVSDTDNRIGAQRLKALTGRPSGLPVCR
jgi:hypothetical protein